MSSVPGLTLETCGFYMGFRFIEAISLGSANLNFGYTFLMVFLVLMGMYTTLRGIAEHSVEGAFRQTKPAYINSNFCVYVVYMLLISFTIFITLNLLSRGY
jgi:uncharacterized membrane protein YidH (DUF202 family)